MKFSITLRLPLFCLIMLAMGCSPKPPVEEDIAQFNGDWIAASVEEKGRKLDAKAASYVTVSILSGKFHRIDANPAKFISHGECGFTINTKQTPTHFDLVQLEGDKVGLTTEGIVSKEGAELKLCFAEPGKPRPKEFTANDKNVLMVLELKK